MRINNKDVDLLALWILFFVRKKFVSSRNYLYFPVQVPNINTSFKIFVSLRKQPFYMFGISIPLITVLLIIIIIIILWQSLYLYQLDICIVLVSLLRLMQRLLFMRFLDIRILCWFVDCCSCVFWIFVFCVVRLLRLMQRLLI